MSATATATASHCHVCGTHLLPNDRFCSGCGTRVDGLTPPPAPVAPVDLLLERLRHVTLGLYDVHSELGRGGMAAVYLAHDLRLHRKVAIKVMLPELFLSEGMADRFLLEARTAARLSHPNIVVIHAVSSADDLFYFVMSLVEGGALDDILNVERPLPVDEAKWVLTQAARALYHAHSEGVVHRDVKPANIMINLRGDVVLTDFGIAKASESPRLTRTGMVIGTPSYMSPEQIMAASITSASDQYSLGIVAYELLSGETPFRGSALEMQWAHVHNAAPDLATAAPWVPSELAAAVMRMLAKNPEERWESLEVVGDIFADGLPASGGRIRQALALRAGGTRRGAHSPTPQSPVPSVPQSLQQLEVGAMLNLGVLAADTGGPREFICSDPAILAIDASGTVRALAAGSATVSVVSTRQKTIIPFRVSAPPRRATHLRITPSSLQLEAGDHAMLAVSAHDEQPDSEPGGLLELPDTAQWQSDNEQVATVTADGRVTAHAPGRVSVHVSCGTLASVCDLTVVPAAVARLEVTEGALSLVVRDSRALGVTTYDRRNNVTMAAPAFESADRDIVRVDEHGNVEAVAPGTTTVTISSGAARQRITVTVKAVPLRDIRVMPAELLLVTGRSARVEVHATDVQGNSAPVEEVSWTSQQRAIATVTNGVVQGHAPGATVVSARVGVLTADVRVAVLAPVPARVELAAKAPTLRVGRSTLLTCAVFEADGTIITGLPVEWTSANNAVATVDTAGQVHAIAAGKAHIVGTAGGLSATIDLETLAPLTFPAKPVAIGALVLLVGATGVWVASRMNVSGSGPAQPSGSIPIPDATVSQSTAPRDSIPAVERSLPGTQPGSTTGRGADTTPGMSSGRTDAVVTSVVPVATDARNRTPASRDTARPSNGARAGSGTVTPARPLPPTNAPVTGARQGSARVPAPLAATPPVAPPSGGSTTASVDAGKPPAAASAGAPEPADNMLTVAGFNGIVAGWLKAHGQSLTGHLKPNARNSDLATRLNRLDARKFNEANGCQVVSSEPQGNAGRVVISCPSVQSGGNPGTVLVTLQVVLSNREVSSAEIVSDVVFKRRD